MGKDNNNGNSILEAFKQEFSTTVHVVHVNSLGMDLKFKEVSVTEQKSLSKIMIENENRKDIVYDTQCALINKLCLDKIPYEYTDSESGEKKTGYRDFDIYELTEFDRIRILMEIYQNNYFHNDIEYTCKECGQKNTYKLEFSKIINKFNEFDLKDKTYYLEDSDHKYAFVLNYPSVRNVSSFYKNYMKQYKGISQKQREILDNLGNIEYINLFIKSIELTNKNTGKKQVADLTIMTYSDIEQLISMFPQNIVFSDEQGVLKHIATEFIEKINNVFAYEKCAFCGAETQQGIGGVMDFF